MKNLENLKDQKILELKRNIKIERRQTLEKMFNNAFPGKQIRLDECEEGYCLRIVETEEPRRFIIIIATDEFLTKERIPFKKICKEGIECARQKLKIFQRGFLGYLTLSIEGVKFEGSSEIYDFAANRSNS